MRAESDWVTAVGVGRIQDKTRWTKAVGEAVTVVYGDCNEDIELSKHGRAVGFDKAGQSLRATIGRDRVAKHNRERGKRGEVIEHGEPMSWLWHRGRQTHGSWVVERSSRRIPWCRDGQVGKEDQSSLLA